MRLLIFNAVAIALGVVAYALGAGGSVAAMVYLFVLFNGVLDRWVQPMIAQLRGSGEEKPEANPTDSPQQSTAAGV